MSIRRSKFILALAVGVVVASAASPFAQSRAPGVAVLAVDTDRVMGPIDRNVYGHFLEHINHSVVDGLFAEQVRGQGFEGSDFQTYWRTVGAENAVSVVEVPFERGTKSVRLVAGTEARPNGIRQGRVRLEAGREYNGSLWVTIESRSPRLALRVLAADGAAIATVPLTPSARGTTWQEVPFAFTSARSDRDASIEISATGSGSALIDFISLARADVRASGMLRPDLVDALRGLAPPFIRWPGGSFASTYKWKDGIGPRVARVYHPNDLWGGYSDYYGFGTDEFMALARELGSDALIVLPAPSTRPEDVQYAMDWVHYLIDPPTTEWGKRRADNGHADPYPVRYFQIDNEPMNNGFTAEGYAEIVNVYGAELRKIAPTSFVVACGQKRSNDMAWSQTLVDVAGENFDILGVHNYEYESDRFQPGVQRIGDYLRKLRDYIRLSTHAHIKIAVLEWNLSRTYDWRAGLHAAGSLMLYETLGPELTMAAPALLMRNTEDDPTWTAFIYHDHVSWFPGGGYIVEKLFREHYAETYLASTSGTFRDLPDRKVFFDDISQMKPEAWQAGTVDAIATASTDGRRIVVKAVNYVGEPNTLLVRLQGARVPADATVRVFTIAADPSATATLDQPNRIAPVETSMAYTKDMTIDLAPYSVALVEVTAK